MSGLAELDCFIKPFTCVVELAAVTKLLLLADANSMVPPESMVRSVPVPLATVKELLVTVIFPPERTTTESTLTLLLTVMSCVLRIKIALLLTALGDTEAATGAGLMNKGSVEISQFDARFQFPVLAD